MFPQYRNKGTVMRIAVVDIGGTKIKSGIWEDDRIIEKMEADTEAELGGMHVMQNVAAILRKYHNFDAIGVSTTGQVDSAKGEILYANQNMPAYTGTRVREILEKTFGVPVAVQNDVNAAAIGEAYYGAAMDSMDFLCLTYGTGVGGAIVMHGKIYTGASFSAGEFGAIITHPKDRDLSKGMFSGCYERYASTTALVKRAQKYDPSLDSGCRIFERIGEKEVQNILDGWIDEIVIGLISLTHIFNPQLIVLGGGIMEQPYILDKIRAKLYPGIMPSFAGIKIVSAKLGNTAGLLGAAQEAMEVYHESNAAEEL